MKEVTRTTSERSPWGVIVVVGSLGCLVGGILWPGFAESLFRLLLVSLALGWAAARGLSMGLPAATMYDSFSPFEGVLADGSPPSAPDVVQRRARTLVGVDDPDGGAHRPIPWPVAQTLIHETARRLEVGRGLRLNRPEDVPRIRRLVSDSTWTLLGLGDTAGGSTAGGAKEWIVSLARMDDILDDLERL